MYIKQIYLAVAFIGLFSCANQEKVAESDTNNKEYLNGVDNAQETTIWVNSFLCADPNSADQSLSFYVQEYDSIIKDKWVCTPAKIEGFKYEVGHIYHLKVERTTNQGMPSYKLVEILSKDNDPEFNRIHDIWVLTHLQNEAVTLTDQRPTAEINLTDKRISGKGVCNSYSGEIISYSATEIKFGPLLSTRMACPNLEVETAYLKALETVTHYSIKGLTLYLYDNSNKELLRFQKVD